MAQPKIFALSCALLLCLFNTSNAAGTLEITKAWSPEAPPVAKVMAGYMTIKNKSDHDIKILSAKSSLFEHVEIHLMEMNNGMMRMIKQDKLLVKAHGMVELKPGELHMMLIGPKKIIRNGTRIPVSLMLDNQDKVTVNLMVMSETDEEPMQHHHH